MTFWELSVGSLFNPLSKGIEAGWKWIRGRKGNLTPSNIVQASAKWKPIFTEKLNQYRIRDLRKDVIVRDVKRLDGYLNINKNEKGISSWFRVGLAGTYHGGIQLILGWYGLAQSAVGGFRLQDYNNPEERASSITTALIGFVPYQQIEHVDWEGDEYYGFPILYCHFDAKNNEPYERLAYCEKKEMPHPNGAIEFYVEVADHEAVQQATKDAGIKLY